MKFPLTKPIPVEGNMVGELDLRTDIEEGDLEVMDDEKGDTRKMRLLLAQLTGVPPSSIKKMAGRDFLKLVALVQPFLLDGPQIGETSAGISLSPFTSNPTKSLG
jgi:hypothetical protein